MNTEIIANIARALVGKDVRIIVDKNATTAATDCNKTIIIPDRNVSSEMMDVIVSQIIHERGHIVGTDPKVKVTPIVNLLEDIRNDVNDRDGGLFGNWMGLFRAKWEKFFHRDKDKGPSRHWQGSVLFWMKLRAHCEGWEKAYLSLDPRAVAYLEKHKALVLSWIERAKAESRSGRAGTAKMLPIAEEIKKHLFASSRSGTEKVSPVPPVNPPGPINPIPTEPVEAEEPEAPEEEGEKPGDEAIKDPAPGDDSSEEGEDSEGEDSDDGEEGEGSDEGSEGGEGGLSIDLDLPPVERLPEEIRRIVERLRALDEAIRQAEKSQGSQDGMMRDSDEASAGAPAGLDLAALKAERDSLVKALSAYLNASKGGEGEGETPIDEDALWAVERELSQAERAESEEAYQEEVLLPAQAVSKIVACLKDYVRAKNHSDEGEVSSRKLPNLIIDGDIFHRNVTKAEPITAEVYFDVSSSMTSGSILDPVKHKCLPSSWACKEAFKILTKIGQKVSRSGMLKVRYFRFGSTSREFFPTRGETLGHFDDGTCFDGLFSKVTGKALQPILDRNGKWIQKIDKDGDFVGYERRLVNGDKVKPFKKRLIIIVTDACGDISEEYVKIMRADKNTRIVPIFIGTSAESVRSGAPRLISLCPNLDKLVIAKTSDLAECMVRAFEAAVKNWIVR